MCSLQIFLCHLERFPTKAWALAENPPLTSELSFLSLNGKPLEPIRILISNCHLTTNDISEEKEVEERERERAEEYVLCVNDRFDVYSLSFSDIVVSSTCHPFGHRQSMRKLSLERWLKMKRTITMTMIIVIFPMQRAQQRRHPRPRVVDPQRRTVPGKSIIPLTNIKIHLLCWIRSIRNHQPRHPCPILILLLRMMSSRNSIQQLMVSHLGENLCRELILHRF